MTYLRLKPFGFSINEGGRGVVLHLSRKLHLNGVPYWYLYFSVAYPPRFHVRMGYLDGWFFKRLRY